MELVPGLHRLQIPIPENPLGHLNAYAIRDDDGWALVDAGFNHDEAYKSLVNQIQELAGHLSNLRKIILTHWHPDHFGLARRIRVESGAQIVMHEHDVDLVNAILSRGKGANANFADWLVLNGVPREEAARIPPPPIEGPSAAEHQFKADLVLRGGERLKIGRFAFDVIWTPGHTPGHVCLYEPGERILISGDHVLPIITPSVSYHPGVGGNPLQNFLNSLRALAELEVRLVLPAHEEPFSDLRGRVEEIEKHHIVRCDEILAAIDGSAKSAYQISSGITWAEGQMQWTEMPQLHRMLAVGETIAHLYYMRHRGIVEVDSTNGRKLWRRPIFSER